MPLPSHPSKLACRPDRGYALVGKSDVVGSDSADHVRPPLTACITDDAEDNPRGLSAAAAARRSSRQQGSRPASGAGGALAVQGTTQQQGEAAAAALAQRLLNCWGPQSKVPKVGSGLVLQVIGCTAPRIGGRQLTHRSCCSSLEGLALTSVLVDQATSASIMWDDGAWARVSGKAATPAERRWSLQSWQVSRCQIFVASGLPGAVQPPACMKRGHEIRARQLHPKIQRSTPPSGVAAAVHAAPGLSRQMSAKACVRRRSPLQGSSAAGGAGSCRPGLALTSSHARCIRAALELFHAQGCMYIQACVVGHMW